jgi:hypothetical protein
LAWEPCGSVPEPRSWRTKLQAFLDDHPGHFVEPDFTSSMTMTHNKTPNGKHTL